MSFPMSKVKRPNYVSRPGCGCIVELPAVVKACLLKAAARV